MNVSILALDSDTCVDHCSGSSDGLCPRVTAGETVRCAGLRVRVNKPSPAGSASAVRSWVWTVNGTAAACPVWSAGQPGLVA